jgi:hypothetical protein
MKRFSLLFTAATALALAACGPAEVVVTAEIDLEDPATGETVTRQLSDLEVQLLPFDRDQIFDSLTSAAAAPEPQVPQELLAAQNETADAQRTWRDLESRWNTLRDTLQTIKETMDQFSRGEARYTVLYREFNDMDAQLGQVERRKDQAFAVFDSLSKANIQRAQEYRVQYDEWANEAFADVDAVMLAHQRASGLPIATDTTDAQGVARFEVKPGHYWVYARYAEPYSELYWNEELDVARGEPVTFTLTRGNAEVRPKF